MAISKRDVQNSFELHLKDLLTKFDAEISVGENGEVEVFIARAEIFKNTYCPKRDEDTCKE